MGNAKAGRPRSQEARMAVLRAAGELLRTGEARDMTVEGVAKLAGVGKQTIYRWWPGLADIVYECLLEVATVNIPPPDTGSLQGDVHQFVARTVQVIKERSGNHLKYIMAEAQRDAAFGKRFRESFVLKRRQELKAVMQRHLDAHQALLDLAADLIYGPIWYRLLVGHLDMDLAFVQAICAAAMDHVVKGVRI